MDTFKEGLVRPRGTTMPRHPTTGIRPPARTLAFTVAGSLGAIALLATAFTGPQAAWAEPAAAADPGTAQAAGGPVELPVALTALVPNAAEYGTRPDPNNVQRQSGAGVIDTTPLKPHNNATWFWPKALKVVASLPPDDFALPEGKAYASSQTDLFASEGFFVTGVGLWGRTRNMYHWVDYDIPPGAARFTGDVLITDDPFGWFAGRLDAINQEFEFIVQVDGKDVVRRGETRHKQRSGSGAKLMPLDIQLPPGAKTIRFGLEVTPWGAGNKNVELVITDGTFHAAVE
jgi:hypothetical protein